MDSEAKNRKKANGEFFDKVVDFIEHFYPGVYDGSREDYVHADEDRFKLFESRQRSDEDYNAWFLLKHVLANGTNVVKTILSFPDDYFDEGEKQMLQNLFDYRESLFEIVEILEDGRVYVIRDLGNDEVVSVRTFDLDAGFVDGDLIKAIIVKDWDGEYFFLGGIMSFKVEDRDSFVGLMLLKIMVEEEVREEICGVDVEWKDGDGE